jgi:hypothetical protein
MNNIFAYQLLSTSYVACPKNVWQSSSGYSVAYCGRKILYEHRSKSQLWRRYRIKSIRINLLSLTSTILSGNWQNSHSNEPLFITTGFSQQRIAYLATTCPHTWFIMLAIHVRLGVSGETANTRRTRPTHHGRRRSHTGTLL